MGSILHHDQFGTGTIAAINATGTGAASLRTAMQGHTQFSTVVAGSNTGVRQRLNGWLQLGSAGAGTVTQHLYPSDGSGNPQYVDFSVSANLPAIFTARYVVYDTIPGLGVFFCLAPQAGMLLASVLRYITTDGSDDWLVSDAGNHSTGYRIYPPSTATSGLVLIDRQLSPSAGSGDTVSRIIENFASYAPSESYQHASLIDISFVVRSSAGTNLWNCEIWMRSTVGQNANSPDWHLVDSFVANFVSSPGNGWAPALYFESTNGVTSNIGIIETTWTSGMSGTAYDPQNVARDKLVAFNATRSGGVAIETIAGGACHDSNGDTCCFTNTLCELSADAVQVIRRSADGGNSWTQLATVFDTPDVYGGSPTNDSIPGLDFTYTGGQGTHTVTLATNSANQTRTITLNDGVTPRTITLGYVAAGQGSTLKLSDIVTAVNAYSGQGWHAALSSGANANTIAFYMIPPTIQSPVSIDMAATSTPVSLIVPKTEWGPAFGSDGGGSNYICAVQRYPLSDDTGIEIRVRHSINGGSVWATAYTLLAAGSGGGGSNSDFAPNHLYYGPYSKYWYLACYSGDTTNRLMIFRSLTPGVMPTAANQWTQITTPGLGSPVTEPMLAEMPDQTLVVTCRSSTYAYFTYSTDHATNWSAMAPFDGHYTAGAQSINVMWSYNAPVPCFSAFSYLFAFGQGDNDAIPRSRWILYRSTTTITAANVANLTMAPYGQDSLFGGSLYNSYLAAYGFPYFDGAAGLYMAHSRNIPSYLRDPNFFGQVVSNTITVSGGGNTYNIEATIPAGAVYDTQVVQTQYANINWGPIACVTSQTGKTHKLAVFDTSDPSTVLWTISDSSIFVSTDGMSLTIVASNTNTQTGPINGHAWQYVIQDLSDGTRVAQGEILFVPAPLVA